MPSIAESPAWYSRATLVLAATMQAADRGRGERDRLRHLRLRQPEERPGRDRAAEDRGDRAVEAALAAARGERLVDAPRDLVAEHHRREHVAAARAGRARPSRSRSWRRSCRCARCCAGRCRPRRRRRSSPRSRARRRRRAAAPAVEPDGRLRRASALSGKLADDPRRTRCPRPSPRWRSCWRSPSARAPAPAAAGRRCAVRKRASSLAILIGSNPQG